MLHRQSPRTQVSRSYIVSTSFTSRSPYGRSVFVPTNSMYYDIAQKAILFLFSPKGVASHLLPEGRGFRATLEISVLSYMAALLGYYVTDVAIHCVFTVLYVLSPLMILAYVPASTAHFTFTRHGALYLYSTPLGEGAFFKRTKHYGLSHIREKIPDLRA